MELRAANWPNVKFDYNGAVVLVTGGTNGIGNAIARAYKEAGAEVTITGRRPRAIDYEDVDLRDFRYFPLEVMDDRQVEAVGAEMDRLDILINNAGVSYAGGGSGEREYEPDIFERGVKMHLVSPFRMAQSCYPKLKESRLPGGASVIGIASLSSYFAIDVVPGYGAGKAGLVQMTKTLAVHWAQDNIRVNAVAAGTTETEMTKSMLTMDRWMKPLLARTPMGRMGHADEIAGCVLFLTSAAASFVTGQTLLADGGYSIMG